jgi:hypothetical protein
VKLISLAQADRRSHGSPFTFHTTVTSPFMSTSKAKAKATSNPPLSLEDTLHDMAVIRSTDIDLAAILASAIPAPSPVSPTGTATWTAAPATAEVDASVARSHEFAQAARAAIKIKNRGDVEAQGERVNEVRGQLEEVVEGLVGSS